MLLRGRCQMNSPFKRVEVIWENTDLPYTVDGGRQCGRFKSTLLYAWCWAHVFAFLNPRAHIRIDSE